MQIPRKSGFEQVHRVSEFGGLNLVKIPFSGNVCLETILLFAAKAP